MATDLASRIKAQQEIPDIEVKGFSGLSLKLDSVNQPAGVWQQLDNCDLYVPGSIRKILPPRLISSPGVPILDFVDWYTQPNRTNGPLIRTVGLSLSGSTVSVWDFATAAVIFTITNAQFQGLPKLLQAPVFFVPYKIRSWATQAYAKYDGILKYDPATGLLNVWYVSTAGTSGANQPVWSAAASPITDNGVVWTVDGVPNSSRYLESALVIILPGFPPFYVVEWQYNPNNSGETPKYYVFPTSGSNPNAGIPPQVPVEVQSVVITPNLDGYAPQAGRAYSYTLYNPNLLHETSPAPIAGPTKIIETDNSNANATIPGSIIPPITESTTTGTYSSYQELYAAIPLAEIQAINPQYTCIYLYATKDGGATFFRVTQILDNNDNIISNSDGSVPIAVLVALQAANGWQDYFPLPTPQAEQNSVRLYEGGGTVNLAPDPVNLGTNSWLITKGKQIFVQPDDSPEGDAAFEMIGTGSAFGVNEARSNVITVAEHTDYFFQGYIDATWASAGSFLWEICDSYGTAFVTFPQSDEAAGYVSGTFNTGAVNKIRLKVYSNGATITDGEAVQWSEPILEIGTSLSPEAPSYPTTDSALVIPSPAPLSQGPFPALLSACIYQGALIGIDFGNRLRYWYSLIGDVLSLPAANYKDTITSRSEPILEILEMYDRVLLGKQRQLRQITGSPPNTPFDDAPIDPQHGTQSGRGSIADGSSIITLLSVGIALVGLGLYVPSPDEVSIGFRPEQIIGDPVKPITDGIIPATLRQAGITSTSQPCPAIDNTQNIYLFAFQANIIVGGPPYNDTILLGTLTHKGPSIWSKIPPTGLLTITQKEVQFLDPVSGAESLGVLASKNDGNVYLLFGGTQDGTITATAVTWPLPDLTQLPFELRDTIKIFREIWVEGEDIPNWQISWSTDGKALTDGSKVWSPARALQNCTQIGARGRQIEFKFTHAAATTNTPLLSYMKVDYDIDQKAAGTQGAGANY